jgi:PrtD family type I secretion system ABC transporter
MSDQHQLPQLLRRFRGALVSVGIFSFFFNLLILTLPLYMLSVFTRVLTSQSEQTLFLLTVAAMTALAIQGLLDSIRSRVMARVGTSLNTSLTPQVLEAMVRNAAGSGSRNTMPLRDVSELRTFISGPAIMSLFDAPFAPFYVAVIFILHPDLGAVALVGALVLFGIAVYNEAATRNPIKEVNQHNNLTQARVDDYVRNADAIESMGMMPSVLERWRAHNRDGIDAVSETLDKSSAASSLAKFVRMTLQISLFGVGAFLVIENQLSAGAMIAASILMSRALAPVESAIGTWRSVVGARAAYRRLQQVLAPDRFTQYRDRMEMPRPGGRVELDRIVVMVPNSERLILKGVSLGLRPGDFLGIVGPSGAGKSTLAKVLVGLITPRGGGGARLDGAEISAWHPDHLGQYVGYLPQDVQLFPGTVRENIARMAPDSDPEAVIEAAKRAGVHDLIVGLPQGYDTDIGDAGRFLSAGQRQHIGLARAFFGDPVLMVLDEPNSNLDAVSEEALSKALAEAKERGTTIVVVTHRPTILNAADQLMVLKDGAVELYGPTADVMARMRQGAALTHEKQERIAAEGTGQSKPRLQSAAPASQAAAGGASPPPRPTQARPGNSALQRPRPAAAAARSAAARQGGPTGAPRQKPAGAKPDAAAAPQRREHPRPAIDTSIVRAEALLAKGDGK